VREFHCGQDKVATAELSSDGCGVVYVYLYVGVHIHVSKRCIR
jgi:hypothetical protein